MEVAGIKIRWVGEGVGEKAFDADGRCIVAVDPRYFRPAEVESLLGDASKAREKLGWKAQTDFRQLVTEMMEEDLKSAERDELVRKHGFSAYDYHE
jgi:GDPmannose 4,6-dehydratase